VKYEDGSIDLIETDNFSYLEATGKDTLIRTNRKNPCQSVQRIGEAAKKYRKTKRRSPIACFDRP
jgi:hypothetical protein